MFITVKQRVTTKLPGLKFMASTIITKLVVCPIQIDKKELWQF